MLIQQGAEKFVFFGVLRASPDGTPFSMAISQ
jgi:hypothetical protein